MACEIQSALSLFEPSQKPADPFNDCNAPSDDTDAGYLHVVQKHTYSHDLESLWWLILWIITSLIAHRESYANAYVYFRQNDVMRRTWLLKNGGLPVLDPRVAEFRTPLNNVRSVLWAGYQARDPRTDIETLATYKGVTRTFVRFFAEMNKSRDKWGSVTLREPASQSVQSAAYAAGVPQGSAATVQSDSRKRKEREEDGKGEVGVGRATRPPTVKAPEAPGPEKRTRN